MASADWPDTLKVLKVALEPDTLARVDWPETVSWPVKVRLEPETEANEDCPATVSWPEAERLVAEAGPKVVCPETCKEVKVAFEPEARLKIRVPDMLAEVKVALLKEALAKARLPKESTLNLEEELICRLMKSPLKIGELKPIMVPEAEPEITVKGLAVAERKTREEVAEGVQPEPAMVSF